MSDAFNTPQHAHSIIGPREEELMRRIPSMTLPVMPSTSPCLRPQDISAPSDSNTLPTPLDSPNEDELQLRLPPSLAHALLLGGLVAEFGFDCWNSNAGWHPLPSFSSFSHRLAHTENGLPLTVAPSVYSGGRIRRSASPELEIDDSEANTTTAPSLPTFAAVSDDGTLQKHAPTSSQPAQTSTASERSTPELTDASTATSRSASSATRCVSRRRKRSADKTTKGEEHYPAVMAGDRYACLWAHVFGGDCTRTFGQRQEHDKHLQTHIPDANGVLYTPYRCRSCVQSRHASDGRVTTHEIGLFPRKDALQRHIRTLHPGISEEECSMQVTAAPWWWPSPMFLSKACTVVVERRPSGETLSWREKLEEILHTHPDVRNKPYKPLEAINKQMASGTPPPPTPRPFKWRKTMRG